MDKDRIPSINWFLYKLSKKKKTSQISLKKERSLKFYVKLYKLGYVKDWLIK